MKKDFQPRPLKLLFERNNAWAEIMETTKLREIEIEVVTKMLACGTTMMGFREYCCKNENCTHQKLICFTCKGRGCPSCGTKLTDNWIHTSVERLSNGSMAHLRCRIVYGNSLKLIVGDSASCSRLQQIIYSMQQRNVDSRWVFLGRSIPMVEN